MMTNKQIEKDIKFLKEGFSELAKVIAMQAELIEALHKEIKKKEH